MTTPRNRNWVKMAGAVAVVVVLSAAVLLITLGHRSTQTDGPVLAASQPAEHPLATVGANETSAGAVALAVVIVGDEPLLVGNDAATAAGLVDTWATPSARPSLLGEFSAARAAFMHAPGGPFSFDAALLADRAVTDGVGRLSLDAWCAEVVFDRGQPASALYETEHMGLVWMAGGWRLNSMSDTPGPSVGLSGMATPAVEAAAALAGFVPPGAATGGGR